MSWKKPNTKKVWWSGSSGRAPVEALSSNSSTTKKIEYYHFYKIELSLNLPEADDHLTILRK
jgi:hypothetical protein